MQLDCKSYGLALSLATSYQLDADQVHKRQWTAGIQDGVEMQLIDDCLVSDLTD